MAEAKSRLIDIPRDRLDEAVGVLAAAFHDDPLMGLLFRDAPRPYDESLQALQRFACLVRFELRWPLMGAEVDGRLAGVLGVTMPDEEPWPESLRQVYADLGDVIGSAAIGRLEAYSGLADAGRPVERHHHVGVLGVHPDQQGKGIGRELIEAMQALSRTDPASTGVALDTENPASRAFYEHCGYHTTGEAEFEGVKLWSMFRPN